MRLGLDLRGCSPQTAVDAALEADRYGLWAVQVDGPAGTETLLAAEIAMATSHVHIAVRLDAPSAHPTGLAEEIAVLDHLSNRRALAIIDGPQGPVDHVRRLLAGEIVDGFALAPPPAQTAVSVWHGDDTVERVLSGELDADRQAIDDARAGGTTHLFVRWPTNVARLARHLMTRARTPGFPDLVADYADIIAPLPTPRDI